MVKCYFCGISNIDNTIFCSECGHYLLDDENKPTDPLDESETGQAVSQSRSSEAVSILPSDIEPRAIRLKIGDRRREIEVPLNKVIYLGRIDPGFDVFPDVDLSEYGPGISISRRHASIQKRENRVVVEDRGSINGTFLNGQRLSPFMPQPVNSGDTLYLGRLRLEIEIMTDDR